MRFALQCEMGPSYWGPTGQSDRSPIWMTAEELDTAFAVHDKVFGHKPILHRIVEEGSDLVTEPE